MTEPQWLHFSNQGPKRKRADVACALCHAKKIRCDLHTKDNRGQGSCTNCLSFGKECQPRASKREKMSGSAENRPPQPTVSRAGNLDNHGARQISLDLSTPYTITESHVRPSGGQESRLCPDAQTGLVNGEVSLQPTQARSLSTHASLQSSNKTPTHSRIDPEPILSNGWSSNWSRPSTGQPDLGVVDPDFLRVYGPGNVDNARNQILPKPKELNPLDALEPDLRQSYSETYFEYCYTWCPVFDRSTLDQELNDSSLLENALGIVGSNIRPPMIPHPAPATYYARACRSFYEEDEQDLVATLKAVSLFYWWAPRPPSVVHRHSSWWWTAVVIRHAQQAGFHRSSELDDPRQDVDLRARRRIWWTAFARERLTAICQGKPCIINPKDCNMPELSLDDFPETEDRSKSEIFIHWVRLCAIIGRIAKALSRSAISAATTGISRADLGKELVQWVRTLPPHLQLHIGAVNTRNINRDVHQLHLPYLAVIVLLHLTSSSQTSSHTSLPATMAASCIARILKDILVRSGMRYLMPITCWYTKMAFLALLQATKSERLKDAANADIEILLLAIKQLKIMWGTATLFEQGFERLRANSKVTDTGDFSVNHIGNRASTHTGDVEGEAMPNESSTIDWIDYFPFVTSQTSSVADKLLAQHNSDPFLTDSLLETSMFHYQDFVEDFDSWDFSTDSTL